MTRKGRAILSALFLRPKLCCRGSFVSYSKRVRLVMRYRRDDKKLDHFPELALHVRLGTRLNMLEKKVAMELFVSNQEFVNLEASLSLTGSTTHLSILISTIWQLRQRDCQRALALAQEAEVLLAQADISNHTHDTYLARLLLVKAEINWLIADLEAAENQANAAITAFEQLDDRIGAGDGNWLMASVWLERGNGQRRDECMSCAIAHYRAGNDIVRVNAGLARTLHYAAFRNANATAINLADTFGPGVEHCAMVMAWVESAHGVVAGFTGDPGNAIKRFLQAHLAAKETGQIRHAILSATNAADSFSTNP